MDCIEVVLSGLGLQRQSAPREENKKDVAEEIVFSGEMVKDRIHVCSACGWETPCLRAMEDHKNMDHHGVDCPHYLLVGEQRSLGKTIYKRLVNQTPSPVAGFTPPCYESVKCTKCSRTGFPNQKNLHEHILECAGVVVEPGRNKRRRTHRRRRTAKRRKNPSTSRNLPAEKLSNTEENEPFLGFD